ncbi:helix-turn-helix domain-containing protein [Cohnella massiliensis]|uniref:helix-turn-helix domain-containing protein n=1 Tax=Cohnella massiliensis TaxID=1816691 RepID=UPI001FE4C746|nr:helix-turn-helix domain-containing protein [Cohnella massiliensis]
MRSTSFLTKLTVFGFLLSTLPVLFIGLFSYATSSREIQSHVNKGKIQLLIQINANVEQILVTVNHTLNQVLNSTVLKRAMGNPLSVNDFTLYDNLRNELRHMQSFDTRLEDVVLINRDYNWMVKNSGLYRFDEYAHYDEIDELVDSSGDSAWMLNPSDWFYSEENAGSAPCRYSISLAKKLPVNGLDKSGLALANIPACALQDFLSGNAERDDRLMVVGEDGRLLLHPDPELIGQPLEAAGLAETDKFSGDSGQFRADIDQQPYSVTYYRSPYNNWTYVSFTSIGSLTKESDKIGMYTLLVCLFMLLFMLSLAWIGSRRMYSPVQQLMLQLDAGAATGRKNRSDEFQVIGERVRHLFQSKSRLEQEVHRHIRQVSAFYLMKAYQGGGKPSELEDQLERFGYGERIRDWELKAVLTLQIDSLESTGYEKRDAELLLFAIQNMIEEIIPAERRLAPVTVEHTVVLTVGGRAGDRTYLAESAEASRSPESAASSASAESAESVEAAASSASPASAGAAEFSKTAHSASFKEEIIALTEELQKKIADYLRLTVSIGISLPFRRLEDLSNAYREGLEALRQRLKLGGGIIVQYEHLNAGKHVLSLHYPHQLENELIEAVKLADKDRAKELLHQFLVPVFASETSPRECQIPLTRLLNNLLVVMQESGIAVSVIHPERSTLYEDLLELNTSAEIEEWFWSCVVHPMLRIFRDRQEAQYANISEKIIDLVHRYYDTDLTLEECAARLHYNPNYLSSVFRKETGRSFSEYLTAYRFQTAKKWLAETDIPIKDIAAKLRYNNSQNFIRSFRKQEGITPGQFRESRGGRAL